jgi:hypothetical protein
MAAHATGAGHVAKIVAFGFELRAREVQLDGAASRAGTDMTIKS